MQILMAIIGFLLAITILVGIHEFGHFWVARLFGIKVLRFSIGFGRPLLHWYDKLGTEYVISLLPFGGYVSLFGEKSGVTMPPSERPLAYCYKPIPVRIAVLLAGPLFNFLFAIAAYWLVFMIGISSFKPILGEITQDSAAERAGLKQGQVIVSVENKPTPSWESVSIAMMQALGEKTHVMVNTERSATQPEVESHKLDLSQVEQAGADVNADILKELGFTPLDPFPPTIQKVLPDHPAALAGIEAGDTIVAVNDHPVASRFEASEAIQPKNGELVKLTLKRDGETREVQLTPVTRLLEDGKAVGFIGVEYEMDVKPAPEYTTIQRFGVIESFKQACTRTWQYIILTLEVLKKMVVGTLSIKHLSGPIAIAQYAGYSVSIGAVYFISFLAVISISLGVLNLLPIPLLDGGNIVYCLCELITGKPLSERAQTVGFVIGGLFIIIITLFAFYNDISRF